MGASRLDYVTGVERVCARDEREGATDRAIPPEQEALCVLLASVSRRISGRSRNGGRLTSLQVIK